MFPDFPHLEQVARDLWRPGPFGGASVMVGAGFSRNARPAPGTVGGGGMPMWHELTSAMLDELYPSSGEAREQRDAAARRAGGISGATRLADEYEAQRGRTALDRLMLRAIPDAAYEPGPMHRLLCSLPWADILTTNYDTLIERALPTVSERRYDVVRDPEDLPGAVRPRVVKLHGSFPSSRPFVITEEDFRTYETRAAAFVNLARQAFVETTVCLLGFSGDDPNFLRWSGWTRDVLGSARVNPIFLCGVLDLSPSQRALLQRRHVLPIDVSPLFPPERWPDRGRRLAAATEWLLLALEAGRPVDLSEWPLQTVHPATPAAVASLPKRPVFSFVRGLDVEEMVPGFLLPGDAAPPAPPWRPGLSAEEQIAVARLQLAEHGRRTSGEALQRQIGFVVDTWSANRSSDPGWVVLPQANRRVLWDGTRHWVEPIVSTLNEKPPEVRLARLDELTWRFERCLIPLGNELGRAASHALSTVGGDGDGGADDPVRRVDETARTRWLGLAGRLLRHHRETCADAAFDALADRMSQLSDLDPELHDRVAQERCLAFLERWNPSDAETTLDGWKPSGDPIWFGRRAGLLAEFDRTEALEAVDEMLLAVRSGLAAVREPERRTYWLSREAMALTLAASIKGRWERRYVDVSARFVEIRQAGCDIRADLDALGDALARAPGRAGAASSRRGFLDDLPETLRARQLRRALEDLGQPLQLVGVNTAAAEGVRRSIPWLADGEPDVALRAYARLYEDSARPEYAELWLARASGAIVDGLADAICLHLQRMSEVLPTLPGAPARLPRENGHEASKPGRIRHEHTRAALRLGRVLLPRLDEDRLLCLVDACLDLRTGWRGGEWQTWDMLGRVARTALSSVPNERRGERLLAVVRQPLVGRDVTVPNGDADGSNPVFPFLQQCDDALRRSVDWDAVIDDMLGVLASDRPPSLRAQSLRRLWAMYTRGILNDRERTRLRDAVWIDDGRRSAAPDASGGSAGLARFAAGLTRYPLPPWTLIFLPEPTDGAASNVVRAIVSGTPLARFGFREEADSGTFRSPNEYDDPIHQALAATSRPWTATGRHLEAGDWTADELTRALGNIEGWWDCEGRMLAERVRDDPTGFANFHRWRLTSIVEFLAYVVLPACVRNADVLRCAIRLADKLREGAVPVELLVPLRLAAGSLTTEGAGDLIADGLSASDPERFPPSLEAILVWLALAERGELPALPVDLIREVAEQVRTRRSPNLTWALGVAAMFLERPGDPWSALIRSHLATGLLQLERETRPDDPRARYADEPYDVMALRGQAASLLRDLSPHLHAEDPTSRAWLERVREESFTSIRRTLESVLGRMPVTPEPDEPNSA